VNSLVKSLGYNGIPPYEVYTKHSIYDNSIYSVELWLRMDKNIWKYRIYV